MPSKSDIQLLAKLADLDKLRAGPLDSAGQALLARALSDRTNLVVARAAEIIGEWQIAALEPGLIQAYERLAIDGVRRDPSCAGKIAITHTLRTMDLTAISFWLDALRYVQLEPSYGPPIDTGAPIRVTSALVLANSGHPETLLELAPLLSDPSMDARLGAIRAVGVSGQPGASALLWFKVLTGDPESEPYYEAFVNLLVMVPDRALPFVAGFLLHDRPGIPESAALALGESHRVEAFPYLREAAETADDPAVRSSVLLGLALLRQDTANNYLLETIADGSSRDAEAALKALEIVRPSERLWELALTAHASRASR